MMWFLFASHLMPHNVVFMAPFKKAYSNEIENWLDAHPYRSLSVFSNLKVSPADFTSEDSASDAERNPLTTNNALSISKALTTPPLKAFDVEPTNYSTSKIGSDFNLRPLPVLNTVNFQKPRKMPVDPF